VFRLNCQSVWLLSLLVAPLSISPATAQQQEVVPAIEETAIEQAVEDFYIEGLRTRRFELIRSICLPDARLMSVRRDGSLGVTTLDRWSQRFDPDNPPFSQLQSSIVKIDREGTAAQVKIHFLIDAERHVFDFLHMLKLDGRWRIAGIIDY